MEPARGVEPPTRGLRNRCSTTELRWLFGPLLYQVRTAFTSVSGLLPGRSGMKTVRHSAKHAAVKTSPVKKGSLTASQWRHS